jgi:hypothetical protein
MQQRPQRPPPFLTSVPVQRRLLHVALHFALLFVEAVLVIALTVGLILGDVVNTEAAWKLAIGYVMWVAVISSAFSLVLSRFSIAPALILGVHALTLPGSVVLFVVLNLELVLRLLGVQ